MSGSSRALWFELVSTDALVSYMEYRGESVRTLARKSLVPDREGGQKSLSPAMIGQLRSGARRTCGPHTAKAVEAALQAPPGLLFTPRAAHRTGQQGASAA